MTPTNGKRRTWRDEVRVWLPIALLLVSIVTGYAFLRAEVTQNTRNNARLEEEARENYTRLEEKVEGTDTLLVTIQVQLAEIQRDILYIRERLAKDSEP